MGIRAKVDCNSSVTEGPNRVGPEDIYKGVEEVKLIVTRA
jgi:hypothetical protein